MISGFAISVRPISTVAVVRQLVREEFTDCVIVEVPFESRRATVPFESRRATVPFESRRVEVPFESRRVEVQC